MSLWGATVITNLLSAIPVFGQDLVESNYVTELNTLLTTIGTVSTHSTRPNKKGRQIRLTKEEYMKIPSQFIAFLVGFIDGDGYIQITKTTKGFISIKLVINLSLEDISILEYIYSVLKIGKITKYPDNKNPICKLIFNKTELQEIIFPLLLHYNIFFLTDSRRAQFDLAMFILKNDIKLYSQISQYKESVPKLSGPNTASDYIKLTFFKNWLVGFTNAEGSFC